MALNIDCILILAKMFDKNTFDDKLFDRFLNTKATKVFLQHENSIGKNVNKDEIKAALKKIVKNTGYKDKYKFYLIKSNLNQLKTDIQYLQDHGKMIIKLALKKVYKIIPDEMRVNANIYLYSGGTDGGFTISRRDIFINYGNYIGKRKEFINILSHELYHSRNIPLTNRIRFAWKLVKERNRVIYELFGKSIEEGIACLVQHGPILESDDLTGNLTKRNLLLSKIQFDILNNILLNIKFGMVQKYKIEDLNIYVIGYIIVSTIYSKEGVLALDEWTINLEFRRIITKYIEICNKRNIPSGFEDEVIEWVFLPKGYNYFNN